MILKITFFNLRSEIKWPSIGFDCGILRPGDVTFLRPNASTIANTYLLNYLLTPWSKVLLEKVTGSQLVKKIPAFYGTRRFITVLTSARHLSLSWANSIQSLQPPPTSWRSILILSSHLRLGLHSGLLPSGFPLKTLYTPLPSPIYATCPAYLIFLDLIHRIILGEEYRSLTSSLCSLLHSPFTFSLLVPSILLSTLFPNTLSQRSFLNVSDHVSHLYYCEYDQ